MDLSGLPGFYVGPNSFCNKKSGQDLNSPAPKYFTDVFLHKQMPTDKEAILKGLVLNESG